MSIPTLSARRLATLLGSATATSPAYRGLADGLRLLIADGQVPSGTRLPSERALVEALGLSRTTVTRAYALLRERGYAVSHRGSGTVAALPDAGSTDAGGVGSAGGTAGPAGGRARALPGGGALGGTHPAGVPLAERVIDLTCASLPAVAGTAAAVEAAAAALPAHLAGSGYHPLGLPALRERLAQGYGARGLPTEPDQVMVTSGAVAGLATVARALLQAGDRVLVENPTYPNAVDALRHAGARLVATPVGRDGWDVEGLVATVAQTAPRAAYLVPDFHNPTGALMGEADRRRVGGALATARTLAVVDETMADLRLEPHAAGPPPLAAYAGDTVTVGSASKSHWGGLRVGWLRAPRRLLASITQARLTLDLGTPVLEQLVLLELLGGPDPAPARAELLAQRRALLLDALAALLPDWRPLPARGGLSVWVELPEPVSTALTVAAERHRLLLTAGPRFSVDGSLERWLRIPFTRPAEELAETVRRLAVAAAEVSARGPGRARPARSLIA